MTEKQLSGMRARLERFLEELVEPMGRSERRHWAQICIQGLLLDGQRKSMQPMAERIAGVVEEALNQFLNQSPLGGNRNPMAAGSPAGRRRHGAHLRGPRRDVVREGRARGAQADCPALPLGTRMGPCRTDRAGATGAPALGAFCPHAGVDAAPGPRSARASAAQVALGGKPAIICWHTGNRAPRICVTARPGWTPM